jgi:hypothetical protein
MGTYRLVRILRVVLSDCRCGYSSGYLRATTEKPRSNRNCSAKGHPYFFRSFAPYVSYSFSHFDAVGVHLTAKEQFYFKDNTYKFRDVRVVISSNKPDEFDQIITGNECVYDDKTRYVHFTGNVNAQLDATTWRERRSWSTPQRTVPSCRPANSYRAARGMTGDVDHLKYLKDQEL